MSEKKFHERPVLNEGARLRNMIDSLGHIPNVKQKPKGGEDEAMKRIFELYVKISKVADGEEGLVLTVPGFSKLPDSKVSVHLEKDNEEDLNPKWLCVDLIDLPGGGKPDISYYYWPAEDGSVIYSAVKDPEDAEKMTLFTDEEIGISQAENVLRFVTQLNEVTDFKAYVHHTKHLV